MNKKVIEVMAKSLVRFEAKLGNTITIEEARKLETKRLERLDKINTFPY